MEYGIFIFLVATALLIYHLCHYPTSGYGKFSYYVDGEVGKPFSFIICLCALIWIVAITAGIIYLGGELIKYLFF